MFNNYYWNQLNPTGGIMNREVTISLTEEQYDYFSNKGIGSAETSITRVVLSAYKAHLKPGHLHLEDFLFNNFDFDLNKRVSATEVYNLYLEECDMKNCEPISRNSLYNELRKTSGLRLSSSTANRLWVYGISL